MESEPSPQKQTDPENGHQNYSLCLSGLMWSLTPASPPSIFLFLPNCLFYSGIQKAKHYGWPRS